MAFESAHTLASWAVRRHEARRRSQLPHLDRLVKTATDEAIARWSKRHTVDAVLVTLLSFEAYNKLSTANVPYTHALVQGTGGDISVVWGDGNGGDTVFDREVCNLLVPLEIPQADAAVSTAGSNDLAVAGKVQGVDVLLVASELVLDLAAVDVPHL